MRHFEHSVLWFCSGDFNFIPRFDLTNANDINGIWGAGVGKMCGARFAPVQMGRIFAMIIIFRVVFFGPWETSRTN